MNISSAPLLLSRQTHDRETSLKLHKFHIARNAPSSYALTLDFSVFLKPHGTTFLRATEFETSPKMSAANEANHVIWEAHVEPYVSYGICANKSEFRICYSVQEKSLSVAEDLVDMAKTST